MGQINRLQSLSNEIKDTEFRLEINKALVIYSENFAIRSGVHESVFRNVIQMLGDKKQQDHWIENISEFRMIGCFAMVTPFCDLLHYLLTVLLKDRIRT